MVSRRQFCGGITTCLGLAVVACAPTSSPIETGPLGPGSPGDGVDGPPSGGGDDASLDIDASSGVDASTHADAGIHADAGASPDAMSAATCPSSGATDVGAASTFTLNTPVYHSSGNFFVVRDSNGLYALSSRCTHQGVTVQTSGGQFYCPAHGATFTYNGAVTGGPTSTALPHYAMCTLANGHVAVVTSQTVSASQRLVA